MCLKNSNVDVKFQAARDGEQSLDVFGALKVWRPITEAEKTLYEQLITLVEQRSGEVTPQIVSLIRQAVLVTIQHIVDSKTPSEAFKTIPFLAYVSNFSLICVIRN